MSVEPLIFRCDAPEDMARFFLGGVGSTRMTTVSVSGIKYVAVPLWKFWTPETSSGSMYSARISFNETAFLPNTQIVVARITQNFPLINLWDQASFTAHSVSAIISQTDIAFIFFVLIIKNRKVTVKSVRVLSSCITKALQRMVFIPTWI